MDSLHILSRLHQDVFQEEVRDIVRLKGDGSERKIHRVTGERQSSIGIAGENIPENRAFIGFSRTFASAGLPVPRILAEEQDGRHYLETDLGDVTLYEWQSQLRSSPSDFPLKVETMYEKVIRELARFQIDCAEMIDYSLCYQHAAFEEEAMRFDVNYFREMFLGRLYHGPLNMAAFKRDIDVLIDELMKADRQFFLYRDFQSRNVMIVEDEPFFIDYQSGRKGALQYDVASMLFDAKALIPQDARARLLDAYMDEAERRISFDRGEFAALYYSYAVIRSMQALGAFGNLGHRQGKPGFLSSIPPAMDNLAVLADAAPVMERCAYIRELFYTLAADASLRSFTEVEVPAG